MRTPLLAVIAVAGLAAGCGSSTPAATTTTPAPRTTVSPVPAVTSGPAAPAGDITPQGFLRRKLGEEAEQGTVRFTVTQIDTLTECVRLGRPAAAGQKSIVLHVSVKTAEVDDRIARDTRLLFSDYNIKAVDPAGKVTDARTGQCGDLKNLLSVDVLPNSTHEGTVEFAVPENATAIASARSKAVDGVRGWVWEING